MSLIQEALKRQQEDDGKGGADAAPASPPVENAAPVETPAPDAVPESAPEPEPIPVADTGEQKKKWIKLGVAAGLLVLLLVVGVVMIGSALSAAARKKADQEARRKAAAEQAQPAAAPQAAPAPAIEPTPVAVPVPPPAAASADVAVAVAVKPDEKPVEPAAGAKKEDKKPAKVRWPVLRLNATLNTSGDSGGAAMINNKVVGMGEEIDGATLLDIRQDEVKVKLGDEVRVLRKGE
ncbi:MAG: hypothetical protein HY343_09440 [Lentisphaerae bacterium]|nr:hypothetical protein [Lentisphaerota bacterium]